MDILYRTKQDTRKLIAVKKGSCLYFKSNLNSVSFLDETGAIQRESSYSTLDVVATMPSTVLFYEGDEVTLRF